MREREREKERERDREGRKKGAAADPVETVLVMSCWGFF